MLEDVSSVPAGIRLFASEWLSQSASDKVYAILYDLIAVSQDGIFNFKSADRCPKQKIAAALNSLFGVQERSFQYLSLGSPLARSQWMSRTAYQSAFQGSLWEAADSATWSLKRIWLSHNRIARRSLKKYGGRGYQYVSTFVDNSILEFSLSLVDSAINTFDNTIAESLDTSIGGEYLFQLTLTLQELYSNLIRFLLISAIDKRKDLSRFVPFTKLLLDCIPLACLLDDSRRWLVIVK